jgi:NuA3 HAT complex component NTO1
MARLDEKTGVFKDGLNALGHKLSEYYYTSVATFSADLTAVLLPVLASLDGQQGDTSIRDITDVHDQLNGVAPGTAQHLSLTPEQKELKRITKRIAKAMKEMVDVARKKEAEMKGVPFEKEMVEWAAFDARLEDCVKTTGPSLLSRDAPTRLSEGVSVSAAGGASPSPETLSTAAGGDAAMQDADSKVHTLAEPESSHKTTRSSNGQPSHPLSPPSSTSSTTRNGKSATTSNAAAPEENGGSIQSTASIEDPWARGGTPWYLHAFDISGTTVHDERWTGPETMRAMSETLSEMDEETLLDVLEQSNGAADEDANATAASARPRRTARVSVVVESLEEGTEEQKTARERREKANAKRRAQRRRQQW